MKTLSLLSLFLVLFLSVFLSGCNLPLLKKQKAALQVLSTPTTTVFLNGNHVGKTPYVDEKLKPGEYTVKLVPDSSETDLSPWQKTVKLYSGIMTVIKQNFATEADMASGYVLTLEPIADKDKASLSVISVPDGVVVNLDGEPKGFTPLVLTDIAEGEKQISISSPGFKEENIQARITKGYKLMISVQLAKEKSVAVNEEEEEEATASAERETDKKESAAEEKEASPGAKMAKPYVEIKDTPTGWLNVRSEPSTSAKDETVITQINPGEVYKFIEANDAGWYKIEYEEGKQGWISGKYAKLYKD